MKYSLLLFSLTLFYSLLSSQSIKVNLTSQTALDDGSFHITSVDLAAKEQLILPSIDISHARYFDLFHTWNAKNDPDISCMVIQADTADILYIDLNNDEDMTNDGGPRFFPKSENEFAINIPHPNDPLQTTRLLLQRTPSIPDSERVKIIDSAGNLNSRFLKFLGVMQKDSSWNGDKGSFYFDDRAGLRSGTVMIGNKTVRIGLFDYDNNGLYSDSDDVVIVDLYGDGKLRFNDYTEVFQRNDVFTINHTNYTLSASDPYGTWLELVRTNRKPQSLFLKKQTSLHSGSTESGTLNATFWDQTVKTLNGKDISLKHFKGKPLLLNFWGEWCSPCITELPVLVDAYKQYKGSALRILSILKPSDPAKAKKVIATAGLTWNHTFLTESWEKQFAVNRYPTNILILADGLTFIRTGRINSTTFFERYIH